MSELRYPGVRLAASRIPRADETTIQAGTCQAARTIRPGQGSGWREAFWAEGETVSLVTPLTLPELADKGVVTPELLIDSKAGRLFIERATATGGRFRWTDQEVAAIAAICQRLDGIPLAIELAASRARALSTEQIVERLDSSRDLLDRARRSSAPRHRRLQAAIQWSYELLSGPARQLFEELCVFAGGLGSEPP